MNLEWHLQLAGLLQLALAFLHLGFSQRFNWPEELARLSLLNRQMFLVHTFFVCLVLVLMGLISLLLPEALLHSPPLSFWLLSGIGVFWAARLFTQWFIYDRSHWKGQTFPTFIHYLFTVFWIYLTAVYAGAAFQVMGGN